MSYIAQATDYAHSLYGNLRRRYDDLSFEGKVSHTRTHSHPHPKVDEQN